MTKVADRSAFMVNDPGNTVWVYLFKDLDRLYDLVEPADWEDVRALLEGFPPLGLRMRCTRLELMESRLDRPRGARYRTLDERLLG